MTTQRMVSIGVYLLCCISAFMVPWWLALMILVVPLFFYHLYAMGIACGLLLDLVYGYQIAGFPYHTFRYVSVVILGVLVIFLLKKILRL